MRLGRRCDNQAAGLHGQRRAGRDHIEVFRHDEHTIMRLRHRQRGVRRQEFDQEAFMGGVEVLHQDEGKAGRLGECGDEIPAGLQPAGRSADGDDGLRSAGKKMCRRRDGILLLLRR